MRREITRGPERRLLQAIDRIGPVSVYALKYHAAAGEFETPAELNDRVKTLAEAGYLHRRTLPDVTGDSVVEYATAPSGVSGVDESGGDTPG